MVTNIAVLAVAIAGFALLMNRRVAGSVTWRATVTPLASIIGSGFLVAGPILAHVAGRWAVVAMLGLCGLAYIFGSAIRSNIRYVEPQIEAGTAPRSLRWIEDISDIALTFAYFVSVAYYLNLLGAFALRTFDIVDPATARIVTTAVLAIIGILGVLRGLKGLELLEIVTVGLKLAIIGGVVAGLLIYNGTELAAGRFAWPDLDHTRGLEEIAILLGLVIMVQGFETSRYLGESYPADLRIRTMRLAQLASTGIYVVFIALITVLLSDNLPKEGGESAIIDIIAPVALVMGPLLIAAALASQFSAAVADMSGAGGLLAEVTGHRLKPSWGYLLVAVFGIVLTWSADIFQIIVYASKAFALYYGLQCLSAMVACITRERSLMGALRAGFYLAALLLAIAIVVFGQSVE